MRWADGGRGVRRARVPVVVVRRIGEGEVEGKSVVGSVLVWGQGGRRVRVEG